MFFTLEEENVNGNGDAVTSYNYMEDLTCLEI